MANKFLDIKSMMNAVDTRDKTWYNRLSEDDKKLYSPYMTMKWTASIEHKESAIHEFTLEEVNENVNKHLWTLSKNHKSLLWRLTAMCGSTFKLFHKWIYPKKSKTSEKSKMKELQIMFPNAKQADLDTLDKTLTTKQFNEMKKDYGIEK
jgi:hypothetical protein